MNKFILKITKVYTIGVGLLVIISWIIILFSNETLPEGRTELTFHIVSEIIMALACLMGGMYLFFNRRIGFYISVIALSMLIYSTLNASGYYFNASNIPIGMLMIILCLVSTYLQISLIKYLLQDVENK